MSRFCPLHIYRLLYYLLDFVYLRVFPSLIFISFLISYSFLFSFILLSSYNNLSNRNYAYTSCSEKYLLLYYCCSCFYFLFFTFLKFLFLFFSLASSLCWLPSTEYILYSLCCNNIHLCHFYYEWYCSCICILLFFHLI